MFTGNPALWIEVVFISLLTAAAWLRPLERRRQLKVTLLALIAAAIIFLAWINHWIGSHWLDLLGPSTVHDWLPAVLMLIPYWQVGHFFTAADPEVERHLISFDRGFFQAVGIHPAKISIPPAVGAYLELAYVMVYPLIPLALLTLNFCNLLPYVNYYWIVVLPATYICFAMTPFVQAMPPRSLSDYEKFRMPITSVKKVNNFLLRNASIQAITFPSGHVASAMATALVFLRLQPWAGLIFLVVALSIAVATVVGGYHYAADVLLALLIALAVFAATFWMMKPA